MDPNSVISLHRGFEHSSAVISAALIHHKYANTSEIIDNDVTAHRDVRRDSTSLARLSHGYVHSHMAISVNLVGTGDCIAGETPLD
jgi:hypothetical protein